MNLWKNVQAQGWTHGRLKKTTHVMMPQVYAPTPMEGVPPEPEAVDGLHFMEDLPAVVDFYIAKVFAEGG